MSWDVPPQLPAWAGKAWCAWPCVNPAAVEWVSPSPVLQAVLTCALLSPGQLKLSIDVRGRVLVLHGECVPGASQTGPEATGGCRGDSTSMLFLKALYSFVTMTLGTALELGTTLWCSDTIGSSLIKRPN